MSDTFWWLQKPNIGNKLMKRSYTFYILIIQ